MTMLASEAHCVQAGCPFLQDGSCLDNYPDPAECPNYRSGNAEGSDDIELDDQLDAGDLVEETELSIEVQPPALIDIGGDQALTMTQANSVAAANPTTVVLLAGEQHSGKTTLVAELFAAFLPGPFAGWSFSGSVTLASLDAIHALARISSGSAHATTERTQSEDMRLQHLELSKEGIRANLLMSDVKGEFFDDLVDQGLVELRVPLAARADLCVLVIDGEQMNTPSGQAETIWRARLLLGALTDEGGLRRHTPILLAVSKCDKLTEGRLSAVLEGLKSLIDFALGRGFAATMLAVSARPDDTDLPPHGLNDLVDWLTTTRPGVVQEDPEAGNETGRYFWRSEISR